MADFAVTFDDWSGGHHGILDPRVARPNQWSGSNVIVYEDGHIGPRPGVREATVADDDGYTGALWGVHYQPIEGKEIVAVVGDTVYRAANDEGELTFTEVGALDAEPIDHVRFHAWDQTLIYLTSVADGTYKIDLDADTITKLTDAPGGRCLIRYRDRLFVGGDPSATPWEVFYSENLGDGDAFDPEQIIQIGFWYEAYTMHVCRDRLLLGMQGGGWYSHTGTVDSGQVRNVLASLSPDKDRACVKDDLDRVWFLPQQPQRGLVQTDGGSFDQRTYRHLKLVHGGAHGAFSYANSDILFVDGNLDEGLWRSMDAWAKLQFGIEAETVVVTRWQDDAFLFGWTDESDEIHWGWLQCGLPRPGFTTDTYADADDPDDGFVAELITREWFDPRGREVLVTGVTVDFVAYNYDEGASDCTFTCQVEARSGLGETNITGDGQDFAEPSSTFSSSTGTRMRAVFGAGAQSEAGGFRVHLSGLAGVKILSVTVEGNYRSPMRGAA